jgi:hypothetical protein
MWMRASNHLKLLWPKSMVVGVKEKILLERIRYLLRRRMELNCCGCVEIRRQDPKRIIKE